MNKDIHPLVAFTIIALLLIPLGLRFWAGGEHSKSRVGSFYLLEDAEGRLVLQADQYLVTLSEQGTVLESYDLSQLGISELMGNVAFFPNNDLLVRSGGAKWDMRSYMTLASHRDPYEEKQRQKMAEGSADRSPLIRCQRETGECEAFGHVTAPWRYRLMMDAQSDQIFLTEGVRHVVRRFDTNGAFQASLRGLKFPKRVRRIDDALYVVDTNHHRVAYFDTDTSGKDRIIRSQSARPENSDDHRGAIWTIDAIPFAGHWYAINARNGMQNAELHRLDEQGSYLETLSLPEGAEPFDMRVIGDRLLVSDLLLGKIYVFNAFGRQLENLPVPEPIASHFKTFQDQRAHYDWLMTLSYILLGIFVVGGLIGAVVFARS